jgi:hypothetical protein
MDNGGSRWICGLQEQNGGGRPSVAARKHQGLMLTQIQRTCMIEMHLCSSIMLDACYESHHVSPQHADPQPSRPEFNVLVEHVDIIGTLLRFVRLDRKSVQIFAQAPRVGKEETLIGPRQNSGVNRGNTVFFDLGSPGAKMAIRLIRDHSRPGIHSTRILIEKAVRFPTSFAPMRCDQ